MLDKYKDISDEFNRGDEKFSSELKALSDAVEEIRNHAFYTLEDIQNADTIIDDIDQHFSEKTGILNRKDMAFLWGAVGIQCARWLLSSTIDEETLTPTIDDRKDSSSEGQKDKTASGDKLNRTQAEREGQKYPDKKSIMVLPVPYDAMERKILSFPASRITGKTYTVTIIIRQHSVMIRSWDMYLDRQTL